LHQTDHAIENLRAIVALKPAAPYGALPLAWLRLGEAHDRLGNRTAATDAYAAAIAAAVAPDPHNVRARAVERARRAPDARVTQAYHLSLDGFRRLEQNDLAGAAAALSKSLALNPADPVARYRYGRLLVARKDDAAALAEFQRAIAGARSAPAPIAATTFLDAARLHERGGRREEALAHYRIAASYFGGAAETHAAAARAITRLQSATR
jgi:tetratricopeptide (TPR) repeat protein